MKTSGASEPLNSATKATAPRAKAAAARAGHSLSGPPEAAAAAKGDALKPAPVAGTQDTKTAPRKGGAKLPAAAAVASGPKTGTKPSGNPPAKERRGREAILKEPPAKAPAAKKTTGEPAAPVERPSPAQPAAVNAASVRSATSSPSHPVAAPAPRAKSPAKPQIETHQIVTAPTNDVDAPPPAAPAPAPTPPPAPVVAEPVAKPAEGPRPGGTGAIAPGGRPAIISRASNKDESFSEGDYVVYPTHGVGKVVKIAKEEIAGQHLELIHITFEENRMTLRVPVSKARSAGLRRLSTRKTFDEALAVLKGRARVKRTMWSRRAQEYEAKINSGDPAAIAEVVRDLHRNAGQPDQSFSERQIYEAAMDRLAAELGALDQTDKATALVKLGNFLKTL